MDKEHEGQPRLRKKDSNSTLIATQNYEQGYSGYTPQPRIITGENDSQPHHVTTGRQLTFPTPDETITIMDNVEEGKEGQELSPDKTGTETNSRMDVRNRQSQRKTVNIQVKYFHL